MRINTQQLGSWLRQGAALAEIIVIGILNIGGLGTPTRAVLTGISATLIAIEHYVSDPTTGTGTPPPTPPGGTLP